MGRITLFVQTRPSVTLPFVLAAILVAGSVEQTRAADDKAVPPELEKRMADEKAARRACKIEICKAFQSPTKGEPIGCNITKTWLRDDILGRIVGGSYVWGYGHVQCRFDLSLKREQLNGALKSDTGKVSLGPHTLSCDVNDKDDSKGKAFTVKVTMEPTATFEKGKAVEADLGSIKSEGSTVASAAVGSLLAVDKVSGLVSRAVSDEVNTFIYEKCSHEGVEIAAK